MPQRYKQMSTEPSQTGPIGIEQNHSNFRHCFGQLGSKVASKKKTMAYFDST